MRHAVVNLSDLGGDWRAERHTTPPPEAFMEAKEAGWDSGSRGTKQPRSQWAKHARVELRKAFWKAYRAGRDARDRFLKAKDAFIKSKH